MDPHLERTRVAYDTVAADYAAQLSDQLDGAPVDRHVLATFAELVGSGGEVLDVGCGPGHVTAHLQERGLRMRGVDLSPEMVRVASERYPGIPFRVGSLDDLQERGLAGIVAWYSIIHTPPERLDAVFEGFRAALREGGMLLLAFQVGDELRHITRGYGHDVSLDAWRLDPDDLATRLTAAGFAPAFRTTRAPTGSESVPQAFLSARAV